MNNNEFFISNVAILFDRYFSAEEKVYLLQIRYKKEENMNTEFKYCIDCMSFTTRLNSYGNCIHPKNQSLVNKTPRHEPEWLRDCDEHCGATAKWFMKKNTHEKEKEDGNI